MTFDEPKSDITLSSDQLTEAALSTIRAVIGTTKYQYLSGPITGGRRFIDWYQGFGHALGPAERREARKAKVIDLNIADVQAAAEGERREQRPTIEPGSFEANFDQWGQPEFYRFWERVIAEHAAEVRFMLGWEFSAGCTFEFLCALRHGRPTLDMDGHALPKESALVLLEAALLEIRSTSDFDDVGNKPILDLYEDIRRYRDKIAGTSI